MPPNDAQEYADLKKYIFWLLVTLAPLTAINIVIGILSDSLTIFTIAVEGVASLILHLCCPPAEGISQAVLLTQPHQLSRSEHYALNGTHCRCQIFITYRNKLILTIGTNFAGYSW